MTTITFRAGSGKPCPCCRSETKGCSLTQDGLAFCRGEPSDGWIRVGNDDEFTHYRRKKTPTTQKKRSKCEDVQQNWDQIARLHAAKLTSDLKSHLADSISLPVEALNCVPDLGYEESSGNFTYPESDHTGTYIGISKRSPIGKKFTFTGSKRGLILPVGWQERPGPLFVVEGLTDTLAMQHAGLACIGRPSSKAGAKLLTNLIEHVSPERKIIIVGENDQKENGHWPGLDGAKAITHTLSTVINRDVSWSLPPDAFKDCRDYLCAPSQEGVEWKERGQRLSDFIMSHATAIAPSDGGHVGHGGHDSRPFEIVINAEEHRVNSEAIEAISHETDLFQHAGRLVRIVPTKPKVADSIVMRPHDTSCIHELPDSLLREMMTRQIKWLRQTNKGKLISAHPPAWCIKAISERKHWNSIRKLAAVVNHPVILSDGTLLCKEGYHAASQLYVKFPTDLKIVVPENPTALDVKAAVELLQETVQDFPFETPSHFSAWLASLLTPLARFTFEGMAPLFLIDGNCRAVGKGLLANVAAIILTGGSFAVMSYANQPEELRKRITSLAAEGERLVLFDNVSGPFGNAVLDAALTTDRWKDRLLGTNKTFDGPLNITWYCTGNNVQLMGDISRRVLHIRMETQHEKPELRRDFKHPNLGKHVRDNRSMLLSAALTILRGWFVAGKPRSGISAWGSFQNWSDIVRECIVYAGLEDPGLTREALMESSDHDAANMTSLLRALHTMDEESRGFTTAEVIFRLKETGEEEWRQCLKAVIPELCKPDASKLGALFRKYQKRNFAGRVLDKAPMLRGNNRWLVKLVTSPTGIGPHHLHHVHQAHHKPSAESSGKSGLEEIEL